MLIGRWGRGGLFPVVCGAPFLPRQPALLYSAVGILFSEHPPSDILGDFHALCLRPCGCRSFHQLSERTGVTSSPAPTTIWHTPLLRH